jgi:hypothetical protein
VLLEVQCTPDCFFTYKGVLDRETGLVWQRDPSGNPSGSWSGAVTGCLGLNAAFRAGWRLATAPEMMSLLDITGVAPTDSLPAGHPFDNATSAGATYWTATDAPDNPAYAMTVNFLGLAPGFPGGLNLPFDKTGNSIRGWCVRGPE